MGRVALTFAGWDYDRTAALRDGRVQVDGVDLNYIRMNPEESFWRNLRYREFGAAEISLSNLIMLRDRGDQEFVGIPIFLSRIFRHSNIFVNPQSGVRRPEDLKGKRVGAPGYHMTAILWIKGILQHEYGVTPWDVHWVFAGQETTGQENRIAWEPPPGLQWEKSDTDTLNAMLERGDIDVLISARSPSSFRAGSLNVQRLFPNYQEVEAAYYERTGLFPIMHAVALRREIYEREPWIARNLLKAFTAAKNLAVQDLMEDSHFKITMPWLNHAVAEQAKAYQEDWWSYGVPKNRHTIEAMTQYAHEQGLTSRKVAVEELFADNVLEDYVERFFSS